MLSVKPEKPEIIINLFWIDENIDNEENTRFYTELYHFIMQNPCAYQFFRFDRFKTIPDFFKYLKNIKFEATIIMISGSLYYDFISRFIHELNSIFVIPKIVIFTSSQNNLSGDSRLENVICNQFYNYGGIKTSYEEIKGFILNEIKNDKKCGNAFNGSKEEKNENPFIFEYVDSKEKLLLPLFYKSLIDSSTKTSNIEFIKYLCQKYENTSIKQLLRHVPFPVSESPFTRDTDDTDDIPKELLSKYYARIYTYETGFYKDMNKDLKNNNNNDFYLPFIKTLYKGVEMESLPLASKNNILYRGTLIESKEIDEIKEHKQKKNNDFSTTIVFSKVFLSFSKNKDQALEFIPTNKPINTSKVSKVLFVLEKDPTIDFSLSTHADIESISNSPNEEEVLFFPFSSFEIKSIQKYNEEIYQINIFYLGKYLKEFKNDKKFTLKEETIPDSEFKKHLMKSKIVKPENVQKINIKTIFNKYNNYIEEIKQEKKQKKQQKIVK